MKLFSFEKMQVWEAELVRKFANTGGRKIDNISNFISLISFLWIFWFASVGLILFLAEDAFGAFMQVFVVTFFHFLISEGIFKRIIPRFVPARKRPYLAFPETIRNVGKQFSDASFPSSHMSSTVGMVFVLTYVFPAYGYIGIPFAFMMGFSRMHNGMHYLSDVLIGSLLGIAYGIMAISLVNIIL